MTFQFKKIKKTNKIKKHASWNWDKSWFFLQETNFLQENEKTIWKPYQYLAKTSVNLEVNI